MSIHRESDTGVRMGADAKGVHLHRWYAAEEEEVGREITLTYEEIEKLAAFVEDVAPRAKCPGCGERTGERFQPSIGGRR